MKVNVNMAYKPQYGPGTSKVAENRRKQMDPNQKLEKMRDVTDEDVVLILGHGHRELPTRRLTRRSPSSRSPTAPSGRL